MWPAVPPECWALAAGAALDAAVGDPAGWPHPVRAIGGLTARTERALRCLPGGRLEYLSGAALLAVVAGASGAAAWGVVALAGRAGAGPAWVAQALLIYYGLAARGLGVETLRASDESDLGRAREALAMVVGRDTAALDRPEVCRACVETVAENGNDAVVAPLFWFMVGGCPGLWVYKAVNTLDSMVGYRNDRYRRLGWASARTDDLLGWVPARLTWLLTALAAGLLGERPASALRTGWRDGRKHPSPNAGWGEAAMAGALGVQLGGPATYGGVASEKPRLGDPGDPIGPATVRRAVRVTAVVSAAAVALAWLGRAWVLGRA